MLFTQMIASSASTLLLTGVLLAAALATTRQTLSLPLGDVVTLVVLLIVQGTAIGWIMGGLALVFKRVEASFQILQFVFVGFLLAPWELSPLVPLIPFAWPHRLLQLVTVRGERLWSMPWPQVAGAALVSVAYSALGWAAFRWCLAVARRLARLGHY